MKNATLFIWGSLLLSGFVWSAEQESWSAQSTEKQFEQKSEVINKKSKNGPLDVIPVKVVSQSKASENSHSQQNSAARTLSARPSTNSSNQQFWIFDAWVELHIDEDRDGYFSQFSLGFDADTTFSSAEVYARLYLAQDEVFREFHTTNNFTIYDDSSDDSLVVESELLTGFPSAEYEILIELYDAYDNQLVAVYDGNDDADLYLLSLESQDRETLQVVVVEEQGGSFGLWILLLLPLILLRIPSFSSYQKR
jgi:hypothetical protein